MELAFGRRFARLPRYLSHLVAQGSQAAGLFLRALEGAADDLLRLLCRPAQQQTGRLVCQVSGQALIFQKALRSAAFGD